MKLNIDDPAYTEKLLSAANKRLMNANEELETKIKALEEKIFIKEQTAAFLAGQRDNFKDENQRLLALIEKAMALINEQAEDDCLWFGAATASEEYLQQALRRLHAALEGDR